MMNPLLKDIEIIDFHTHPFPNNDYSVCAHKEVTESDVKGTLEVMDDLNISKFCGAVITKDPHYDVDWAHVRKLNDIALELRDVFKGRYVPGFHIHPKFVRESCEEIERMAKLGVNMMGELVPYFMGWQSYADEGVAEILDVAEDYNMVVSIHSISEEEDSMDKIVKEHPNLVIVGAHPGEVWQFRRHMERMKMSENYLIDVSGYGIFRHGMTRHAIDLFGAERVVFGSDYPTCNPGMYIGGILLDNTLKDSEKEMILSKNAKRLLNI